MKVKLLSLFLLTPFLLIGCVQGGGDPSSSISPSSSETPTSSSSEPAPEDKNLVGKKLEYFGGHGPYTYEEGTTAESFAKDLGAHFPNGDVQLRETIAQRLSSYDLGNGNYVRTSDEKTWFGIDGETHTRTLGDGSQVTTYNVNKVDNHILFEFGKDPAITEKDVYHFYAKGSGSENYVLASIFNQVTISTYGQSSIQILDDGITYENGVATIICKVSMINDESKSVAKFPISLSLEASKSVNITKQPEDCNVDYPNGYSMSIEVDHPEKVLSYRWYVGSYVHGYADSFSPVIGTAGSKPTLVIPSSGCAVSVTPYKCLVTTAEREFFSEIADLCVNGTDTYKPVLHILDYSIKSGETLDLSTTPYGTGSISYESETEILFNNVHFNNANLESCLENVAFQMESWKNPHNQYEFKFVGENVINNEYWEEDNHQGGFGFNFHFAGDSVIPEVHFYGPGSLTIIGGTRAISGDICLNVHNDLNIIGLPTRLTKGIVTRKMIVSNGASISGSLGGEIIFTEYSDVILEPGSRVDAVINPGKVSVGETNVYGISAAGNLDIDNAEVTVTIRPDYILYGKTNQIVAPLVGLHSFNGDIKIKDSKVNVDITGFNVPQFGYNQFVTSVSGLQAEYLDLENSRIDINVDSLGFIDVKGIYAGAMDVNNCDLNIFARGYNNVAGILGAFNLKDVVSGELSFTNSKVNIHTYAETIVKDDMDGVSYLDAGIRARGLTFTLDKNSYINIETNEASALVMQFEKTTDKVVPIDGYSPLHLTFNDVDVLCDEYEVNLSSFDLFSMDEQRTFHIKSEVMYAPKDYTKHITKVVLTAKTN